jgi:hypothetical protein
LLTRENRPLIDKLKECPREGRRRNGFAGERIDSAELLRVCAVAQREWLIILWFQRHAREQTA